VSSQSRGSARILDPVTTTDHMRKRGAGLSAHCAARRSVDASKPFVQTVRAHYWRRHSYEHALLASPGRGRVGEVLVGVAVAVGRPRLGRRSARTIAIGPWPIFSQPLPVDELVRDLSASAPSTLYRILEDGDSRPLPPALSAELADVLRRRIPAYEEMSAALPGN
jgi:hypothetical protein